MTLNDLIAALEVEDPTHVLPDGFHNPHSYRGDYMELAFEPTSNITVGEMLVAARSALGATYQGYKGGDYTMTGYSDCYLSEYGLASNETIGPLLLRLMIAAGHTPEVSENAAEALTPGRTRPVSGEESSYFAQKLVEVMAERDEARAELAALTSGRTPEAYNDLLARYEVAEMDKDRMSHLLSQCVQIPQEPTTYTQWAVTTPKGWQIHVVGYDEAEAHSCDIYGENGVVIARQITIWPNGTTRTTPWMQRPEDSDVRITETSSAQTHARGE